MDEGAYLCTAWSSTGDGLGEGNFLNTRTREISLNLTPQATIMSDLQRALAQKKKLAFGMEVVPEIPLSLQSQAVSLNLPTHDDEVLAKFLSVRNATFPIQDKYELNGRSFQTYYMPPLARNGPILFCHHGAGSSALTFYSLAAHSKRECKTHESIGVFAFDSRGHGNSWKPDPADYSLQSFTEDVDAVLREFCIRHVDKNALYLVGHSLGGAVLTNFISTRVTNAYSIRGLVVLDIVEETAVRALSSIPLFLSRRPRSFECYADAIQWHLLLHLLRNEESAAISVVDLLRRELNGTLTWKADLDSMSGFWDSWFVNLSDNFVACGKASVFNIGKLLVLSGNDALDKELIIGQMQGKYQLIVFNNTSAGHFIHEDVPKQTAITIMDFVRRNGFSGLDVLGKEIKARWGGKINQ